MINEFDKIEYVQLEVSNDSKVFRLKKEFDIREMSAQQATPSSTLDLISGMIKSAKDICKEKSYKTFRLKICLEKEHFFPLRLFN